MSDELRFAQALGKAALTMWPDLPQHVQQELFERAVAADDHLRNHLAIYLHDHHPRTAHPPRPTARA